MATFKNINLLWQISYIQRTKANHNDHWSDTVPDTVVANIIYSKNESKSQPPSRTKITPKCCGKYHIFKERKQITTAVDFSKLVNSCGKYHIFKERKQITTISISTPFYMCCGKYHIFKERKQITTAVQ